MFQNMIDDTFAEKIYEAPNRIIILFQIYYRSEIHAITGIKIPDDDPLFYKFKCFAVRVWNFPILFQCRHAQKIRQIHLAFIYAVVQNF